jgi:hypothetical protein
MNLMKKRWSNAAVWSFICGVLNLLSIPAEFLRQRSGGKILEYGTINNLQIIGFILMCSLSILLGIRAFQQFKTNQGPPGKWFAILGLSFTSLAILSGVALFVILGWKIQ